MASLKTIFQKIFHKRQEPEKSPPAPVWTEEKVTFFYPRTDEEKFKESDDIADFIKKLEQ